MITALLAAAVIAAPGTHTPPPAYWEVRGCQHSHREQVARTRVTVLLHSPLMLTRSRWRTAWHYVVCVKYRASHLRLVAHLKRQMNWRRAHTYMLKFARFPLWVHQTLARIASCESGGNPGAVGGGGAFRGKYQFTFGTWRTVGGWGDPAKATEDEQDYRAALLLTRSGTGPWPVCGQ